MIQIINNTISDTECDELVSFFKNNSELVYSHLDGNVYHFNAIDIVDTLSNFSFTKKNLHINKIDRLRIQHIDKNINMVEESHMHILPYSFVIFLNDDYDGGELVFDNVSIKPKKTQIIYFTGNEPHLVKPVTNGDRYTLVCFLKENVVFTKLL